MIDKWDSAVCQCRKMNYDGWSFKQPPREFRSDIKVFSCTVCKKPDRLALKICQRCTSVFLKDFSHPKWVLEWPCCFPCLESDDSRATEIVVAAIGRDRQAKTIPPQLRRFYLHIIDPNYTPSTTAVAFKFP